jgi:glycosyltransferase involved in cell wall biosynthesis
LKVPRDKIKVITGAVSPAFRPVVDKGRLEDVRKRYGLHSPFILYVGTLEPRKNLLRLVRAFAGMKKRGLPHKLVMVGQAGWHCKPIFAEVERLNLTQDVMFTGYVPFEDLPALYSAAESMAFPSLYEGFGLPVIEAMACGTPVVTSNSSSLAEVGQGAALLVDPLSTEAIADALASIHMDPAVRHDLSGRGICRAEEFTWERSARLTLQVYEEVGSRAPARRRAHQPGRQAQAGDRR